MSRGQLRRCSGAEDAGSVHRLPRWHLLLRGLHTAATSCSKGTYAAAEGSQLCDACPEGKYQGEEGASACIECGDGFTCPEGSVVQIPASCDAGTYLDAASD